MNVAGVFFWQIATLSVSDSYVANWIVFISVFWEEGYSDLFRNRLAFAFCENYFECCDRRVTDHLSITMDEMLGVFYFVFTVYRTIDLCLDWYWWNHFESPTYFFTGTCMLGAAFNLWYIFRALIICRNFEQIDPAKAINIFAELDFHVIEVRYFLVSWLRSSTRAVLILLISLLNALTVVALFCSSRA